MWNDSILLIGDYIHFISSKWLEKSFKGQNVICRTFILKPLGLEIIFSKLPRVNKYLLNAWCYCSNLAKVSVMNSLDL
jgi:hypothetical protein